MRFRLMLIGAVVALLSFPAVAFGADPDARLATLDGASEVPPVATAATGSGWIVISEDESTISYHIEYSGLSGAVVASHIHTGAPGVPGGVIFPLTATASPMDGVLTAADFTASGSVTTYDEALAGLRNGETYFNLHTAANPGGEIRGDLITVADAREATLDGAQEDPPVAGAGSGTGFVVFSEDDSTIWYRVDYADLSGPVVAAHIHTGVVGESGGVILPLAHGPSPMMGALTSADFAAAGTITSYDEAVAAIKAGETYFNLHTAANPGGEIRGQIGEAAAPVVTPPPVIPPPPTSTEGVEFTAAAGGALVLLLGLFAVIFAVAVAGRVVPRRTR